MSPFKVIRCRYYTEDGKAVPPYCAAGRHCTFLHPNDKGWPGGDPLHEIEKRSDERDRAFDRSRPRGVKAPDNFSSHSHDRRLSRPRTAVVSLLDFSSSDNRLPLRKSNSCPSKDVAPPVHSIVQTFHDLAKFQTKLTQDREALDKAADKVTSFRELSKSLSKVSVASAAAIAPTLDTISNARQELQRKVDDDMKQISDLWDSVFNVFLRAICRQFDNELESGTDFLRQEARILLKSFPRPTDSYRHSEESALARCSFVGTQSKERSVEPKTRRSDVGVSPGKPSKEGAINEDNDNNDDEKLAGINPPVGTSDHGWGRKRRRVSSGSQDHSEQLLDEASEVGVRDAIAELQDQLKEQSKKIATLVRRNEEMESIIRRYSSLTPTVAHTSDPYSDSNITISPQIPDRQLSQIRATLHEDVMALISPALEKQKQVNESWESRLLHLSEKLQTMDVGRHTMEVDIAMAPQMDDFSKQQHA